MGQYFVDRFDIEVEGQQYGGDLVFSGTIDIVVDELGQVGMGYAGVLADGVQFQATLADELRYFIGKLWHKVMAASLFAKTVLCIVDILNIFYRNH